ncbi:hypothetical protein PACTADRAFT_34865 [Pachysolen tannophilus NRRL Y-2460]|uniref:F-box domain-containing protein n=1 Tax=Pachysolen tannophilus NRRL Y-2460 TaxID=669874 RepID=A0A1E4TQK2_PACTA|nr:hypothetical protein PACTADRAFT_34865 [Pachysolen tannophilus NRRL Y-2460]
MECVTSSNSSTIVNRGNSYLPPYRSLLTPNVKYDYQLHKKIQLTDEELQSKIKSNRQKHSNNNSSHNNNNNNNNGNGNTTTKNHHLKMKYKSLITDTKKKLKFNGDLFSLNSTTRTSTRTSTGPSSIFNHRLNSIKSNTPKATFQSLPNEVLSLVFWQLLGDQKILVNCLYVCKKFSKLVKPVLYYNPYLTTTYRVGQFVTTLQNNQTLGKHVKILNLSLLVPGIEDDHEEIDIFQLIYNHGLETLDDDFLDSNNRNMDILETPARASWRDWKYRDNTLYSRRPSARPPLTLQLTNSTLVSNGSNCNSSINSNNYLNAGTKSKYYNRSRTNSDATLVRQSGEFYEMYRSFSSLLSANKQEKNGKNLRKGVKRFLSKNKDRIQNLVQKDGFAIKEEDDTKIQNTSSSGSSSNNNNNNGNGNDTCDSGESSKVSKNGVTFKIQRRPFYQPFTIDHPLQNRFLRKYSFIKDLPIGYIIHMLRICDSIVELNLDNLSLSTDYQILANNDTTRERERNVLSNNNSMLSFDSYPGYNIQSLIPDTTGITSFINTKEEDDKFAPHYKTPNLKACSKIDLETSPIFLSDVGISSIHDKKKYFQFEKINCDDLVSLISNLKGLRKLSTQNCFWLNKNLILKFIKAQKENRKMKIDFKNAGMNKNSLWSIEGELGDVIESFKKEKRSLRNWERMYVMINRIGEDY